MKIKHVYAFAVIAGAVSHLGARLCLGGFAIASLFSITCGDSWNVGTGLVTLETINNILPLSMNCICVLLWNTG
jgi:hypothetical protein